MADDNVTLDELMEELKLTEQRGRVEDLPLAPIREPGIGGEEGEEFPMIFEKKPPASPMGVSPGFLGGELMTPEEIAERQASARAKARSMTALAIELGIEIVGMKSMGKLATEGLKRLPEAGSAIQKGLRFLAPEAAVGVGAGIGDQVAQEVERSIFSEEDIPEFGSAESIERSVRDAQFAGGAGVTFKTIGKALGALPGISALKDLNDEERKFARFFFKKLEQDPNLIINPSIVAPRSKAFAFMDNVKENALTTGTTTAESIKNVSRLLTESMQGKAAKLVGGRDVGKLVKRLASDELQIHADTLKATAQKIDLLSDTRIFIRNPIAFLRKEFDKVPTGLTRRKELRIAQRFDLKHGGDKSITIGENQAIINDLTVDIKRLRGKKLTSRGPKEDVTPDDRLATKLETLRSKLINQQSQQIKAAGDPELSNLLKVFNEVQLGGAKKFNIDVLKEVVKLSDEAAGVLYKTIKSPEKLAAIKRALGNTAWRRVEGATYQNLLANSSSRNQITGELSLNGVTLLNNMDKIPPKLSKIMFNKVTKNNFESFARALIRAQGPRASSLGSVFIELVQAGVVTGLFFVGMDTEATIILFGPLALDKLFASNTISKAMVKMVGSLKASPSARSAIFAGFLGLLTEHGIEFTKKPAGDLEERQQLRDPFDTLLQ